jgi:glycosyltransferase involved in cell wall biosynthesis
MINPAAPDYYNTPAHPLRPKYSYKQPANLALRPGVTIITPLYNPEPVFEETVQCILQQSFQNFEWIIVDDGSTDPNSPSRLAALAQQEPRVQVIHQPNQGPAAARNRAVQAARTEYICQIDTDDLFEPTFVEKCLWALEAHPDLSFCNTYSIGFDQQTYLWPRGCEIGPGLFVENSITYASVIRKAAHLTTGGYDESIRHGHEDWDYWLNFVSHGYWGYSIPEYLFWYRRRTGSRIDQTQADPDKEQAFRDFLQQKYPSLVNGRFPKLSAQPQVPYAAVPVNQPLQNPIAKPSNIRRILMLVPWLIMGGADKVNLDLVEQLSARNHEITICTTLHSDNPWLAEFAKFTPDIFNLHNFLKMVDYPRFLLYLIHSRQIDVVFNSHSYLGYQLLPFLRAHCPQVTFVDYLHSKVDHWKSGGYPRAGVGYQELLDLNFVSNHHLKEWMTERGGDPDRIEVCYTNIDPEEWNSAHFDPIGLQQELDVSTDAPILLYGGRIAEEKRPQIFAEVIRRLALEEKLNFTCIVTGDGPYLEFLKEFVQKHRLQQFVRFAGTLTLEQIKELHAAADLFFLPSEYEGISLTLFESMAMETVPVAADVGGQRELVTPDCGNLIPHGEHEIEEYVRVLKHLVESPQKRQAMAIAGRERIVNNFSLDKMTERMVELLNQAQELSKTAPRPIVGQGLGLECATLAIEYTRLEKLADELWAIHHHIPAWVTRLLRKIAIPAAKRMYWTLSAMPRFKQLKALMARLVGAN